MTPRRETESARRAALVRWGLRLNYATIGYNVFEALASLVIGTLTASVALAGFGVDSLIELTASANSLLRHERPSRSVAGIVILALSAVVMPLLSTAKRRVAREMKSQALEAEATQTSLCAYLSVIALSGVALNAMLGWWWADPIAACAMLPIVVKEGLEGIRGAECCAD